MLKHCDDAEKNIFTAKVLNFINPKFDDPDTEMPLAEVELYSFASKCELTTDEFMLALEMATDGKLFTEPENGTAKKVQLFREIDRLKLGEVKSAYIYHKKIDKQYEAGKAKIKAFLMPPSLELSPVQLKDERSIFYKNEYQRLQKGERILGTPIFYDLIKLNGVRTVNLKFLEVVLENFKSETFESGLSVSKAGSLLDLPKKVKHNAKQFFIEALVDAYFTKEKLSEMSETEFIQYWEKIKNIENA